jgi:hypothetical protein
MHLFLNCKLQLHAVSFGLAELENLTFFALGFWQQCKSIQRAFQFLRNEEFCFLALKLDNVGFLRIISPHF